MPVASYTIKEPINTTAVELVEAINQAIIKLQSGNVQETYKDPKQDVKQASKLIDRTPQYDKSGKLIVDTDKTYAPKFVEISSDFEPSLTYTEMRTKLYIHRSKDEELVISLHDKGATGFTRVELNPSPDIFKIIDQLPPEFKDPINAAMKEPKIIEERGATAAKEKDVSVNTMAREFERKHGVKPIEFTGRGKEKKAKETHEQPLSTTSVAKGSEVETAVIKAKAAAGTPFNRETHLATIARAAQGTAPEVIASKYTEGQIRLAQRLADLLNLERKELIDYNKRSDATAVQRQIAVRLQSQTPVTHEDCLQIASTEIEIKNKQGLGTPISLDGLLQEKIAEVDKRNKAKADHKAAMDAERPATASADKPGASTSFVKNLPGNPQRPGTSRG